MQQTQRRLASWVYATLFGVAATYHFFVLMDAEMPHAMALRHLVFFLIDGSFATLAWSWPRWIIIPVGVLTIEQFVAHAGNVWRAWHHGQFDPIGTLTLSGLLVLCYLVVQDIGQRH
jgi:hypothetical protein